jgi:hemolysin activation/secretion protein
MGAALSYGAVAAPNIGDVIRETRPAKEVAPKSKDLVEVDGVDKYEPAITDDGSGKVILVKGFKITGAKHLGLDEIDTYISKYVNQELNFAQLQNVAVAVTKVYRSKGYFVALAYLPLQNMKDGIVEISVIEGQYGEFIISNTSLVEHSILQEILDAAKIEGIVSMDSLERAMSNINDSAGAVVTQIGIMPGKEVGTSDFTVKTETTSLYSGFLLGDNYGSLYTGRNRLMIGMDINSPMNMGDKLSLIGMVTDKSDLEFGKIAYHFPILPNGLRGEVSYSDTWYSLGDRYASLDAYGKASTVEAGVSYPYFNNRREKLVVNAIAAYKNLADYQNNAVIADKEINSIAFGANYTKEHSALSYNAAFNGSVTLTVGDLKIKDKTSRSLDASGANTEGVYNKLNVNLGENIALGETNSVSFNLTAQQVLGTKNLDGVEDFSIGGPTGVKVYPISESNAENGILLSTEIFQVLPAIEQLSHKMSIFYDIGKTWMADDSKETTFKSRTLQDVGIGYYANYENFFAKGQVASIVGGGRVSSEPNYSTRLLVQAGMRF